MNKNTVNAKPLVSVCVMAYQHAKYINQCIKSILMQKTNFKYDIVIGEDGSTDGTREICQYYANKHPLVIKLFLRSRKDVIYIDNSPTGRYNFINTIREATGKYIAYIDGDDYWTNEHKLQKQVDFMTKNTEFSGCFHETQTITPTGACLKKYGDTQKKRLTAEDIIDTTAQIHISSLLFKQDCLEFPKWFYEVVSADIGLFSIISSKGDLGKVNGIMSVYRKHEEGISSTNRVQKNFHKDRISLIQHINKYHNFKYEKKSNEIIEKHKDIMNKEKQKHDASQNMDNENYFLDPKLNINNLDRYIVRNSILTKLNIHLNLFSGCLLDVGCGQMPYREHILARNPKITRYIGLDFAQGKYADLRQPDLTWDGTTIPLDDASVDCAMATEVLEHCFNPSVVLREIKRVLKPGGIFFFTTPFLWPLHDTPHDHYRYTPFALERLLTEACFEDIHIEAMGGWNASLAQMIGLWLKRAPMTEHVRKQACDDLFPFFKQLINTDTQPDDFSSGPMITSLAGNARALKNINCYQTLHQTNNYNKKMKNNNTPKRTIVIVNYFPVISETFILSQITGLIDRGHQIEIWARNKSKEELFHPDIEKYKLIEKTIFLKIPTDFDKNHIHWFKKFKEINSDINFEDINLLHVHFGINFNELKPVFLNLAHPLIVSFHGLDASQYIKKEGNSCYEDLFNRAVAITTPSYTMKNILIANGCNQNKILIHRYGVDLHLFKPKKINDLTKTTFLTVSRLVEKKGLEYSIKAYANLPYNENLSYRIIGTGPLLDYLQIMCKKLNITNKITFIGAKDKNDVISEMQKANVYVLTSITADNGDQEGLPVTLIEAQATGLPVISSIHAGIPELVEHRKTGFLCEEKSIQCIEKYMRILSDHKELSHQLGKNARARVEKEFDINTLNNKLSSIYKTIATK